MNTSKRIKKIAAYGVFTAVMAVLSIAESALTPPNPLNIRLGLSNIVIMYSLFFMRKRDAVSFSVLKSFFVLMTRGAMAGMLSLSGGLISVCAMIILGTIFKERISYFILSVFGAVFHNAAQIVTAAFLLNNFYMLYYLPIASLLGGAAGIVTGTLLKYSLPYFNRINGA